MLRLASPGLVLSRSGDYTIGRRRLNVISSTKEKHAPSQNANGLNDIDIFILNLRQHGKEKQTSHPCPKQLPHPPPDVSPGRVAVLAFLSNYSHHYCVLRAAAAAFFFFFFLVSCLGVGHLYANLQIPHGSSCTLARVSLSPGPWLYEIPRFLVRQRACVTCLFARV